jgi:hypothetical protein
LRAKPSGAGGPAGCGPGGPGGAVSVGTPEIIEPKPPPAPE